MCPNHRIISEYYVEIIDLPCGQHAKSFQVFCFWILTTHFRKRWPRSFYMSTLWVIDQFSVSIWAHQWSGGLSRNNRRSSLRWFLNTDSQLELLAENSLTLGRKTYYKRRNHQKQSSGATKESFRKPRIYVSVASLVSVFFKLACIPNLGFLPMLMRVEFYHRELTPIHIFHLIV